MTASVAEASPLLLLILLRSRVGNHVMAERSDVENGSCSRICRELALACLSILMLHIPEACTRIAESLLDASSIVSVYGIEFHSEYFIVTASGTLFDNLDSTRHALFHLARQSSIQAFSDAYGNQQRGIAIFRALECIKEAATASDEPARSVIQLVASVVHVMLRSSRKVIEEGSASSISALLCIEELLDESTDLAPAISSCLLVPVAAWLHSLACASEIDWLAVATASNLWNAAAASVVTGTNASILDSHTKDSSVSAALELAAFALRRVVYMQPPQNIASDIVAACDSCTSAFRALSSAMFVSSTNASGGCGTCESVVDLAAQCGESLPSHVRCGALLRLQRLLPDDWQGLKVDAKDSVLHAVQTCLFDSSAAVYVAAVEVLCSIGRVDPAAAFSFGSKFLSTISTKVAVAHCDSSVLRHGSLNSAIVSKQDLSSSHDLALCKLLDALGDTVRMLNAWVLFYAWQVTAHCAHSLFVHRCRHHRPYSSNTPALCFLPPFHFCIIESPSFVQLLSHSPAIASPLARLD